MNISWPSFVAGVAAVIVGSLFLLMALVILFPDVDKDEEPTYE